MDRFTLTPWPVLPGRYGERLATRHAQLAVILGCLLRGQRAMWACLDSQRTYFLPGNHDFADAMHPVTTLILLERPAVDMSLTDVFAHLGWNIDLERDVWRKHHRDLGKVALGWLDLHALEHDLETSVLTGSATRV